MQARIMRRLAAAALAGLLAVAGGAGAVEGGEAQARALALELATMLRSGRAVIGASQAVINDPGAGKKELTGEAVLASALERFRKATGVDPSSLDPASPRGRLLGQQMRAIREVMEANQSTINRPGVGFKGFVPAVFGRLVNERFGALAGSEATIKVTAPMDKVRNRKARPDAWERAVIESRLAGADWPRGELYVERVQIEGADGRVRPAWRVLVPEYYGAGCLSCHGEPRGEIDITGYPKEGGRLGELGGIISITLFGDGS